MVWYMDALKYISILAKEGIKYNVGGRGMRGGLLLRDSRVTENPTTLQSIACSGNRSDPIPSDTARLDVLKELRKDNFLLKEDIEEHLLFKIIDCICCTKERGEAPYLLLCSCKPQSKMIFEYLAEWDSDTLMTGTLRGFVPISHVLFHLNDLTSFNVHFQTALKHHPKQLGMLFQKDRNGMTLFEQAIKKHDEDDIFNLIKQCIPTDTDLPILHHVVRDAPKFMNIFYSRYISAIYLRDEDGRSFEQSRNCIWIKNIAQ